MLYTYSEINQMLVHVQSTPRWQSKCLKYLVLISHDLDMCCYVEVFLLPLSKTSRDIPKSKWLLCMYEWICHFPALMKSRVILNRLVYVQGHIQSRETPNILLEGVGTLHTLSYNGKNTQYHSQDEKKPLTLAL